MDPTLDPNTNLQAAAGDQPAEQPVEQPAADQPVEPPTIQMEVPPEVTPQDLPPTDEILAASETLVSQAVDQSQKMPEDKTAQFTKILKIAVPVVVALVVGVGGYFAYTTFFGGNEAAQPQTDNSANKDNFSPNFLTPGDQPNTNQTPTDQTNLENSLKDSLNQTDTGTPTGTNTEDTQSKQKVPRI